MRTYNRQPKFVDTPSASSIKTYTLNISSWKGINDDQNYIQVDQETFADATNVIVDEDNILRSRPSIKVIDKAFFPKKCKIVNEDNSYTEYNFNKDGSYLTYIDSFNNIFVFVAVFNQRQTLFFLKDGDLKGVFLPGDGPTISIIDESNKLFVFCNKNSFVTYYDIDTKDLYYANSSVVYIPNQHEEKNLLYNGNMYTYKLWSGTTEKEIKELQGFNFSYHLKSGEADYEVVVSKDETDLLHLPSIFYSIEESSDFSPVFYNENRWARFTNNKKIIELHINDSIVLIPNPYYIFDYSKGIQFTNNGDALIVYTCDTSSHYEKVNIILYVISLTSNKYNFIEFSSNTINDLSNYTSIEYATNGDFESFIDDTLYGTWYIGYTVTVSNSSGVNRYDISTLDSTDKYYSIRGINYLGSLPKIYEPGDYNIYKPLYYYKDFYVKHTDDYSILVGAAIEGNTISTASEQNVFLVPIFITSNTMISYGGSRVNSSSFTEYDESKPYGLNIDYDIVKINPYIPVSYSNKKIYDKIPPQACHPSQFDIDISVLDSPNYKYDKFNNANNIKKTIKISTPIRYYSAVVNVITPTFIERVGVFTYYYATYCTPDDKKGSALAYIYNDYVSENNITTRTPVMPLLKVDVNTGLTANEIATATVNSPLDFFPNTVHIISGYIFTQLYRCIEDNSSGSSFESTFFYYKFPGYYYDAKFAPCIVKYCYIKDLNTIFFQSLYEPNYTSTYTYTYKQSTDTIYQTKFPDNPEDAIDIKIKGDGKLTHQDLSIHTYLDGYWFAIGNKVYRNKYTVDENGNWQLYIPENNYEEFETDVTGLMTISTDTVAAFTDNAVYTSIIVGQDENGNNIYGKFIKSKFNLGNKSFSDILTTYDGKYTLFNTMRGLAGMSFQDFINSTDQALTFLSEPIYSQYFDFVKKPVLMTLYKYWLYCYHNDDTIIWILDFRTSSWWKYEVNNPIQKIIIYNDELYLLQTHGGLSHFDYATDYYYDTSGINSNTGEEMKHQINWSLTSQKLYLGSIDRYKTVKDITIYNVQDDERDINFVLDCKNYRHHIDDGKEEWIEYNVSKIRTFVKRLHYSKVREFQYTLRNDPNAQVQSPMKISNIAIKYHVGDEVR